MKLFPIRFHIVYIFFTLLVSFFGPRVYHDYDKTVVLLFITIYLMFIFIGFYIGFYSKVKFFDGKRYDIVKLLKLSILIGILLYSFNFIYLASSGRVSFSLSAIGANYSDYYRYYYEKKESGGFTFELIFLMLSAVPKFFSLGLGFFYYHHLTVSYKRLFLFFIFLIILTQTVALGNQKSIGDIAIFAMISLMIRACRMGRVERKKLLGKIVGIVLGLFVLLSYAQYSRLSSANLSARDVQYIYGYTEYDLEHPIFKVFGEQVGLGISTFLTGYLSNGYYGLSKMLNMPFEWTYGIGNSVAMTGLVNQFTGVDVYESTYLNRMEQEYNIPGKKHWHTIFPWLASDYTFVGSLIIFLIVAYYYGLSWKETLIYQNPYSLLLFSLLTMMFIFVPANNQIMHGYDYFVITVIVTILWRKNHKKYNVK